MSDSKETLGGLGEETTRTSSTGGLVVRFADGTVNESEEYTSFDTTARPDLTEVRLYEETIGHVVAEHGAQFPVELPAMVGAVSNAIRTPTRTADSYNNSIEFVDDGTVNKKGHPLRVFVKRYEETTSGYVKTWMFAGTEDDHG